MDLKKIKTIIDGKEIEVNINNSVKVSCMLKDDYLAFYYLTFYDLENRKYYSSTVLVGTKSLEELEELVEYQDIKDYIKENKDDKENRFYYQTDDEMFDFILTYMIDGLHFDNSVCYSLSRSIYGLCGIENAQCELSTVLDYLADFLSVEYLIYRDLINFEKTNIKNGCQNDSLLSYLQGKLQEVMEEMVDEIRFIRRADKEEEIEIIKRRNRYFKKCHLINVD